LFEENEEGGGTAGEGTFEDRSAGRQKARNRAAKPQHFVERRETPTNRESAVRGNAKDA